ncbi:U3 small nucleolar RNA-associated protein 25 [Bienertia sinuspersici]
MSKDKEKAEKITSDINSPLAWRSLMEISLAAKRKHGFVTGAIKKDQEDSKKREQWETCDIIAWIHALSYNR